MFRSDLGSFCPNCSINDELTSLPVASEADVTDNHERRKTHEKAVQAAADSLCETDAALLVLCDAGRVGSVQMTRFSLAGNSDLNVWKMR